MFYKILYGGKPDHCTQKVYRIEEGTVCSAGRKVSPAIRLPAIQKAYTEGFYVSGRE